MIFVVFNSTTGKILRTINTSLSSYTPSIISGELFIASTVIVDKNTQYVINIGTTNDITTRQLLSTVVTWDSGTLTADGVDSCTLSGLPNPSSYNIAVPVGVDAIPDGVITDGSLVFKTNQSGTYIITIDSFPYQLYSQTITAT